MDSNSTNSTNSSSQGGCAAEILAKVEKAQSDTTSSTLADIPEAPVDVEGALDAKFQGNIFWGMLIMVLLSLLHLALHHCISVPHKQQLNLHVMDHWSAIVGRHRHKHDKSEKEHHPGPPPYQKLEFCFRPPASPTLDVVPHVMEQAPALGIGVVIKPATISWQGTVCYDPNGVCSRSAAEVVRVRALGQAETMANSTGRMTGRVLCVGQSQMKLQHGDFIIEINGESTSTGSIGHARQQLAELCLPGNTRKELTMVVLRGTEEHKSHEMSVRVALGKIHPPHSVRDLSHGSVWAAHKAVHLADPLKYKISEAVVGLLKENR